MQKITITTSIKAKINDVWTKWTEANHIKAWYHASDDWWTPAVDQDLILDGRFNYRMEAKDKSMGFNFTGTFTLIYLHTKIDYTLDDGRVVTTSFNESNEGVTIEQTFDPENINPPDLQQQGWQAILDNFKAYVEGQ